MCQILSIAVGGVECEEFFRFFFFGGGEVEGRGREGGWFISLNNL